MPGAPKKTVDRLVWILDTECLLMLTYLAVTVAGVGS
jgi:hypothetical protein